MPGVIKGRKTADGGWEHYVAETATPAALAAQTEKMLQNVKPVDAFEGREVVATFAGVYRDGTDAGVVKHVQVGPKEAQQFAEPTKFETDKK